MAGLHASGGNGSGGVLRCAAKSVQLSAMHDFASGSGKEGDPARAAAGFAKMNLSGARWHLFLCPGPECCAKEEGLATWEALKRACKTPGADALRTKADCLRVCAGGPWLVVYPDGVWYGGVTPERAERIVREHVVGGRPVVEWAAKTRPLCGGAAGA